MPQFFLGSTEKILEASKFLRENLSVQIKEWLDYHDLRRRVCSLEGYRTYAGLYNKKRHDKTMS